MFDITPEEARLLLDVAMLATGRNRFMSAAKILVALGRFRPGNPSLAAANAMLFISMGDFQGAVSHLLPVLLYGAGTTVLAVYFFLRQMNKQ